MNLPTICAELAQEHFRRNPAEPRSLLEIEVFYLGLPLLPAFHEAVRAMGPVPALFEFALSAQGLADAAIDKARRSSCGADRGRRDFSGESQ